MLPSRFIASLFKVLDIKLNRVKTEMLYQTPRLTISRFIPLALIGVRLELREPPPPLQIQIGEESVLIYYKTVVPLEIYVGV